MLLETHKIKFCSQAQPKLRIPINICDKYWQAGQPYFNSLLAVSETQ